MRVLVVLAFGAYLATDIIVRNIASLVWKIRVPLPGTADNDI